MIHTVCILGLSPRLNAYPIYRETANWLDRHVVAKIPPQLRALACKIAYLIDMILPKLVFLFCLQRLLPETSLDPTMISAMFNGAIAYAIYDAFADGLYPYDYLIDMGSAENLNASAHQDVLDTVIIPTLLRGGNVIITGPTGIGKTALAQTLATQWKGTKRVYRLDLDALQSNSRAFLDRYLQLNLALRLERSRAVIFVDEAQRLCNPVHGLRVADLFKNASNIQGMAPIIAATTEGEYQRYFRAQDPGLVRRFRHVPLTEPSAEQLLTILRSARPSVILDDPTISALIQCARNYRQGIALPASALQLIDIVAAHSPHQVTVATLQNAINDGQIVPLPPPPISSAETRLHSLRMLHMIYNVLRHIVDQAVAPFAPPAAVQPTGAA
jgi:hypothetical protein